RQSASGPIAARARLNSSAKGRKRASAAAAVFVTANSANNPTANLTTIRIALAPTDAWRDYINQLKGPQRALRTLAAWALQAAAQPPAGAQNLRRGARVAIAACLVVQRGSGGAAGRADTADDLPDANRLADLDIDRREVGIARREAVAVIDLDHLAVSAI